jgi:hypothetical protein
MISLLAQARALKLAQPMTIHIIVALDLDVIILKVKSVGIQLVTLNQPHVHQANGNAKYFSFLVRNKLKKY